MPSRSQFVAAQLGVGAMLVGAVVFLGSTCSRQNNVTLTFAELPIPDSDASVPHGFFCQGGEMATRARLVAMDAGIPVDTACVVTDLVMWDEDVPDQCRAGPLIEFCREHQCKARRRATRSVVIPPDAGVAERVRDVLQGLRDGGTVIWNAPDVPLIVRVFATYQPCDVLADPANSEVINVHEPAYVFGCANSCPVRLDDVRGELLLDLDTMDPDCAASARICASDRFLEEE